MKKILSILLCLLITLSIVACDKEKSAFDGEKAPYTFIPEQERLSWKDKIVTVISNNDLYDDYEVLTHNFLGMALMDLNFDNTPEAIAAYAGGTMGNVCLIVHDLETGERLCVLGDTPHCQDWNNVYFCVHRNHDGNYILVNEGSLRDGLEWYLITSKLTEDFKFDSIFEEVKTSDDNSRYYFGGNEVDKAKFENQKEQFRDDYIAVAETQIKIVYWKNIDAETKSEAISAMADALVNSEQQFIDFNK